MCARKKCVNPFRTRLLPPTLPFPPPVLKRVFLSPETAAIKNIFLGHQKLAEKKLFMRSSRQQRRAHNYCKCPMFAGEQKGRMVAIIYWFSLIGGALRGMLHIVQNLLHCTAI